MELLIVVAILPLIMGALSVGLIAVFSLQSGVSSRLGNTSDAQVVSANYQSDVQGAAQITTSTSSTPQCTSPSVNGTQVLGVWSNVNQSDQTIISYVIVPGSSNLNSLVRLYCSGKGVFTASDTSTIANNLTASQATPSVACVPNVTTSICSPTLAAAQWVSSQNVSSVTLPLAQSGSTKNNTGAYSYSLVASPAASSATSSAGSPVNTQATTNCYKAAPGTGPLAQNLCFVDFSPLANPAYLAVAETPGTCLEMSASLGPSYNYDKLFFCISITEPNGSNPTTGPTPTNPQPFPVPTYTQAFFGNLIQDPNHPTNSYAFYTGIPGEPAIYERTKSASYADLTNITFSDIKVVTGSNALASGWSIISADAESTDAGQSTPGTYEGLTWTANTTLSIVPNQLPVFDGASNQYPAGNACLSDQTTSGLVGGAGTATPNTITCNPVMPGELETGGQKTGSAMVQATMPTTLTVNLVSGGSGHAGLQGIVFGMYLS